MQNSLHAPIHRYAKFFPASRIPIRFAEVAPLCSRVEFGKPFSDGWLADTNKIALYVALFGEIELARSVLSRILFADTANLTDAHARYAFSYAQNYLRLIDPCNTQEVVKTLFSRVLSKCLQKMESREALEILDNWNGFLDLRNAKLGRHYDGIFDKRLCSFSEFFADPESHSPPPELKKYVLAHSAESTRFVFDPKDCTPPVLGVIKLCLDKGLGFLDLSDPSKFERTDLDEFAFLYLFKAHSHSPMAFFSEVARSQGNLQPRKELLLRTCTRLSGI